MTTPSETSARRRDEEMELHDTVPANCPDCNCIYFSAKDDPEILWEAGSAWEEDCSDHDCHCHTQPVIGRRRDQESINPLDH
jgi:hypothetical protein